MGADETERAAAKRCLRDFKSGQVAAATTAQDAAWEEEKQAEMDEAAKLIQSRLRAKADANSSKKAAEEGARPGDGYNRAGDLPRRSEAATGKPGSFLDEWLGPSVNDTTSASQSAQGELGSLESALERTRAALQALAAHWRETARPRDAAGGQEATLAALAKKAAEDAEELAEEGYEWSRQVGLSFVLPRQALWPPGSQRRCRALAASEGCDGLSASTRGKDVSCHPGLVVAPAPPCGFGVFTTTRLRRGEELGEYTGQVRSYDVWLEEINDRKRKARGSLISVPFIPQELYAAWTGGGPEGKGVVIDAYHGGNTMRFINCSCDHNCEFKPFGASDKEHWRLKVMASRDIEPWEQLSVDYGWYFDDLTLEDVRAEALKAYNADLPALRQLRQRLFDQQPKQDAKVMAQAQGSGGQRVRAPESCSEAVAVAAAALDEARGSGDPPEPRFLHRFAEPETVALLFEQQVEPFAKEAGAIAGIPEPLWYVYEVVGADRVGIGCRCALEPSLNAKGRCSGIIGRPHQARCSGREDDVTNSDLAPKWL
eukprot:TRINITY_DN34030_c0_g1_i1.p1 TRINITY_DN34030_c0_g1~~TRINITY_DN34030_c0_g1_i1.p1  ORF type:complete len:543 (+),score=136.13 TRINITY_DN34030_c0_g1_i1:85-1713(+)